MNKRISLVLAIFAVFVTCGSVHAQLLTGVGNTTAAAGYTVVQSVPCHVAGTGSSCTTSSITVTAGHGLIAAAFGCRGIGCNSSSPSCSSGIMPITDTSGSNSWQEPTTACQLNSSMGSGALLQLGYVPSAAGGTYSFTLTPNYTSADFPTLIVAEVSGTSANDSAVTSTALGNSANPSVTSGSVSQASEFVWGASFPSGAANSANQTLILNVDNGLGQLVMEWTTGPASGTQTLNWTASSAQWLAGVMGIEHP